MKKEITDAIYKAYGTDSGILFGIKDRQVVEAIIEFTITKMEIKKDEGNKLLPFYSELEGF